MIKKEPSGSLTSSDKSNAPDQICPLEGPFLQRSNSSIEDVTFSCTLWLPHATGWEKSLRQWILFTRAILMICSSNGQRWNIRLSKITRRYGAPSSSLLSKYVCRLSFDLEFYQRWFATLPCAPDLCEDVDTPHEWQRFVDPTFAVEQNW